MPDNLYIGNVCPQNVILTHLWLILCFDNAYNGQNRDFTLIFMFSPQNWGYNFFLQFLPPKGTALHQNASFDPWTVKIGLAVRPVRKSKNYKKWHNPYMLGIVKAEQSNPVELKKFRGLPELT